MVRSFLKLVAVIALLTPLAATAQENSIVRSFHPEKFDTKPPADAPAKASQEPAKTPSETNATAGTPANK